LILSFKSDSDILLIGVGKNRELSISSDGTKFNFLLVENLNTLREFTSEESDALLETVNMVKALKEHAVKPYVIDELSKLGFSFVREFTPEELVELGFEVRD